MAWVLSSFRLGYTGSLQELIQLDTFCFKSKF
uniref:Uncharacterized protein n=1 Tax=Rhizophora mucronata TaxID=61149 RepID=A0A2P2NYN1_RHIMU